MPPDVDDDDYNSASDSDFNDAELSASSAAEDESDEAEEAKRKGMRGKKSRKDADGDIEMASGDEGIVAEGRRKKKKKPKAKGKGKGKKQKEGDDAEQDVGEEDEDDDAPVGVRVRLRSGRGGQEVKKAALPTTSAADADIEAIYARMINPSAFNQPQPPIEPAEEEKDAETAIRSPFTTQEDQAPFPTPHPSHTEPTISIPHTYTFAGQTHTSTKTVPISSPAARAYLSTLENSTSQTKAAAAETSPSNSGPTLRRPLARKGLLEPNPSGLLHNRGTTFAPRTDLPTSIGGSRATTTKAVSPSPKTKKTGFGKGKENRNKLLEKGENLNTVEKSKLDWEAEVDRLGMREELEKAEKSGGSYLGRVEFLRRVEGGEEERARVARLKTKGLL